MTKTELLKIAASSVETLKTLEMVSKNNPVAWRESRYGLYKAMDGIWYDLICLNDKYRKWFPDWQDWMIACGVIIDTRNW